MRRELFFFRRAFLGRRFFSTSAIPARGSPLEAEARHASSKGLQALNP